MTVDSEYQIDPVCGMTIPRQTARMLRWKSRNYYFCDIACRDTFRDDPDRWREPMHHVDEAGLRQ